MQTASRFYRNFLESIGATSTVEAQYNKADETRRNFYSLANKTAQMFSYTGLPDTIPAQALERILQYTGAVVVVAIPAEYKPRGFGVDFNCCAHSISENSELLGAQQLYVFPVNLADAPDPYGTPYQVIVTSPGFIPSVSLTYTLNVDAVLIKNDTSMRGIAWLHRKYAALLTEAEISLQSTLVTLRDHITFVAKTQQQKQSVEQYLTDLANGKYGCIMSQDLGSPMQAITHEGRTNNVELAVNGIQAIRSAWYNEIGLNPSFSLKREYTSAQEIDTNTDLLLPAIDDMYECRKRGLEEVNAMFGTSISVEKSSAWRIKEKNVELGQALEEANVDLVEAQADSELLCAQQAEGGEGDVQSVDESGDSENREQADSGSND